MTETDWKLINKRKSCTLLTHEQMNEGKIPTTPTSSSIIAGVQVQEMLKLLHSDRNLPTLTGKGYVFNGLTHDSYIVEYQSVHQAQDFFSRFTSVRYHAQEDLFAFTFDYANFPRCGADARRVWTVWTNGERIRTFRDKQSGQFVNETVQLTAAFRALFEKYGFNHEEELLPQISANADAGFHKALLHLFALTLQMRNSETGNVDVDYLISPVKSPDGTFFDSRNYKGHTAPLPADADANGAFNIARKALWATERLREAEDTDIRNVKLAISNHKWLAFVQEP